VGSGFGFGLGAFLTSFLPLSLLPMGASVPQKGGLGEEKRLNPTARAEYFRTPPKATSLYNRIREQFI
jgi:hypothetical protein